MQIDIELKNLEKTQTRLRELLQAVSERGGLAGIIAKGTLRAHRYATMIVHVLTGRLKNSLYPRTHRRGNQVYGVVGTNVAYAKIEHDRGDDHAYFDRTIDEEGPGIVAMVEQGIARAAAQAGE